MPVSMQGLIMFRTPPPVPQPRAVSDAYLVFMGLAYNLAMIGITWSLLATIRGESLVTDQQRDAFAQGINGLSKTGSVPAGCRATHTHPTTIITP